MGAGNYGKDGHTRLSQTKTVLMALSFVSDAPNYIDLFLEEGTGAYDPEEQYHVLFWTLDELINRFGEKGVFYVNDLYADYAEFAAEQLRDYAHVRGYTEVAIKVLPGDYRVLEEKKYDSIHLKNPEISFYYYGMDGDEFLTSLEKQEETRKSLQHLANLSHEGLYLFIIDSFVPKEEKLLMDREQFYLPSEEWESVPYIYPEGMVVSSEKSRVYFIPTVR